MSARSPRWRKSSRSSGNTGNCVEVALLGDGVALRDSKNTADSLDLGTVAWASLLVAVRAGRLHG
jgi:hypothetical protein